MTEDIIDAMIRRMLEVRPVTPDEVAEFRLLLRREWGGDKVYVRKEPSAGKACLAGFRLAAGAGLDEAFAAAGVSRRHGFRLLSRRWRR